MSNKKRVKSGEERQQKKSRKAAVQRPVNVFESALRKRKSVSDTKVCFKVYVKPAVLAFYKRKARRECTTESVLAADVLSSAAMSEKAWLLHQKVQLKKDLARVNYDLELLDAESSPMERLV